jgi:hypothetical protein
MIIVRAGLMAGCRVIKPRKTVPLVTVADACIISYIVQRHIRSESVVVGVLRCNDTFNCTDSCPREIEATKPLSESIKRSPQEGLTRTERGVLFPPLRLIGF